MVRSWGFFSTCHWFLIFRIQRELVFMFTLLQNACVTLHEKLSPSEPHFCLWKKLRIWCHHPLRSLPSLICLKSGILESPKHQQHPGHPCSLLTSSDQRAEEGGKTYWWLQPKANVPEIFGIQIILKLTHKGLFLTKQCCAAISWGVNWGILFALC